MMKERSSTPVVIDELFSRLPLSLASARVILLCALLGMAEGYDVQVMALAAPLVAEAWSLSPREIGLLLATSVLGIVLGSILLAPMGDRIGRRPATLIGLGISTVFVTLGAYASNMHELLPIRLIAGLGLGVAIPNIIASALEATPSRHRPIAVAIIVSGYPLGASLGSLIARIWIVEHGHVAVFLVGGAVTFASLLLAAFALPESAGFLARNPKHHRRLVRMLNAYGAGLPDDTAFAAPVRLPTSTIAELFTQERRTATVFLWVLNFAAYAMLYFFLSWLPSLLTYRGIEPETAMTATAIFNMGGMLGGFGMALMIRRIDAATVLAGAFVLALTGILLLTVTAGYGPVLPFAMICAGIGIIGSQVCLTAVVGCYYPTEIRAGAAGYAMGVGRLGAVVAPALGGVVLSLIVNYDRVFLITAVPALLALIVTLMLRRKAAIDIATVV